MQSKFYEYGNLIIDNIEGGYYHPDMQKRDPAKYAVMGNSGETMFGMDRKAGGNDITNSEAGKEFWSIIDNANARNNWSYNYKGGSYGKKLKNLACEMMFTRYQNYSKKYLSEKSQKLISKSPKLEIHFYYGCWNGAGNFQKFANAINTAVSNGTTKLSKLEEIAINSRLNHSVQLLRDGGFKMQKIWSKMNIKKGAKLVLIVMLVGGAGLCGWWLWDKYKNKDNLGRIIEVKLY